MWRQQRRGGESTSPSVQRPPDATFTVSGVVSGQGGLPVKGAQVRIAGKEGTSDGRGDYRLSGVPSSYGGTTAIKAGYAAGRKIVAVSGDMELDFELGPRIAIYTVSGVVSEETPAGIKPVEGVLVGAFSCNDVAPEPPFFGGDCPFHLPERHHRQERRLPPSRAVSRHEKRHLGEQGRLRGSASRPRPSRERHAQPSGRRLTITGDTRYHIQLIRR